MFGLLDSFKRRMHVSMYGMQVQRMSRAREWKSKKKKQEKNPSEPAATLTINKWFECNWVRLWKWFASISAFGEAIGSIPRNILFPCVSVCGVLIFNPKCGIFNWKTPSGSRWCKPIQWFSAFTVDVQLIVMQKILLLHSLTDPTNSALWIP